MQERSPLSLLSTPAREPGRADDDPLSQTMEMQTAVLFREQDGVLEERAHAERAMGIEPTISCLEGKRSTSELRPHALPAVLLYPKPQASLPSRIASSRGAI